MRQNARRRRLKIGITCAYYRYKNAHTFYWEKGGKKLNFYLLYCIMLWILLWGVKRVCAFQNLIAVYKPRSAVGNNDTTGVF